MEKLKFRLNGGYYQGEVKSAEIISKYELEDMIKEVGKTETNSYKESTKILSVKEADLDPEQRISQFYNLDNYTIYEIVSKTWNNEYETEEEVDEDINYYAMENEKRFNTKSN